MIRVSYELVATLLAVLACGCVRTHAVAPTKGRALLATRDYLTSGTREKWGYGAYSYVLFPGSPATDERYAALLAAYMKLPRDEPEDPNGQSTPLRERNITYVPVKEVHLDDGAKQEWIVHEYDEARSAAMLYAQGLHGRGPYIVTHTAPLSPARSRVDIAVLDLSSVPKEQMQVWITYFDRSSKAPDEWAQRGAELVLLRMHDLLTELGVAENVTIKAIEPTGKIMEVLSGLR